MDSPLKKCPECDEPIRGRIDKKFCSDMCRNAFNNRLKTDNSMMRNINNILRKNRRIIAELIPDETAKASRQKLMDRGFNFHYLTSTYTTKKGVTYYFCYEYGYLPLDNDYYFLVKRKEGME
ncbi:MAG: hypothetical protein IPG60_09545 [Bacteroidetes bacterium]|nr:hypothetical protein [Bacteroidota bacterium]MBP7400384.1 hypothetical protein [Chitinophagales bacterium]MBK7108683.1 hypothetical protein [Bacteroidota bacterium]MBK8488993.1 hypothetical protein [Bacteroidota bacterium]MBK8680839.1 hypothetical protein [Bacteroidota bacterium]